MSPTVHIVGAGVDPARHLTLEALDVLERCQEVWTNVPLGVFERLSVDLPLHPLKSFYRADRSRRQNYEAVTRHILARALAVGAVAYLTQGHPLIFDSVATNLLRDAAGQRVATSLIGGVSSIDTVMLDVRYDPGGGLQIHEATSFVRSRIRIDPRAALLLFQPSVFATGMPRLTSDAPSRSLAPLRDALLEFYPSDHPAVFVRSSTSFNPPFVVSTPIGELDKVAPALTLASSVFLPPLPRSDASPRVGTSPVVRGSEDLQAG